MNRLEAKNDTIGSIVYLVTDAVGTPIVDRSETACAIFESFINDGAISYRVCGPIPIGQRPEKVEFFTRRSRQADQSRWESCNGNGCRGEKIQFQEETATMCGQFRLRKGHGEHRDLMVKVTLAEP